MLANLSILEKAQKHRYAVGAFNMTSLESALAIVAAAEAEKSPVILQISDKTIDYMGLDLSFAIAHTLAMRSDVPVVIHFDHGRHLDRLEQSLKIGFSSVMLDLSRENISDPIHESMLFVKMAHRYRATCELEEDKIAGKEDDIVGSGELTNPKRARIFTERTGCDAYAVSIGNCHGPTKPNERLDLKLLAEIRAEVNVPLVLHGASSTPEKEIREAISLGITKINIDTDIRHQFNQTLYKVASDDSKSDPRDKSAVIRDELTALLRSKIRLFGSSGQA